MISSQQKTENVKGDQMENVSMFVEQTLSGIIGNRKAITPGKHLVEDLGLDSLKMVELMLAMEEQLDVSIPVADAARIRTVAELCAAVERMKQGREGALHLCGRS